MFKLIRLFPTHSKLLRLGCRNLTIVSLKSFSTQEQNPDTGPVKYSSSAAFKHRAKTSRTGIQKERLSYEPTVIIVSLLVFMIYFFILREENDIDQELTKSLYSRIQGLEEFQLKLSLKYNEEKGLDTSAIRKRLKELEDEKKSTGKL